MSDPFARACTSCGGRRPRTVGRRQSACVQVSDPSFLVTQRMSLEESPRGYELFKEKADGCVRAVFEP